MGGIEDNPAKTNGGIEIDLSSEDVVLKDGCEFSQSTRENLFDGTDPEAPVNNNRRDTNNKIEILTRTLLKSNPELDEQTRVGVSTVAVHALKQLNNTNSSQRENREPKQEYLEIGAAYETLEQQLNEYIGRLLIQGFEEKKMPLPLFYFYPEKWAAVCGVEDYPLQKKAIDILNNDVSDMLDIVTPEGAEKLRIYDFGIGTGQKGEIIINKAIEGGGPHVEYHPVDASENMLRIAVVQLARNIMFKALELKDEDKKDLAENKWRNLILFLKKHDLCYTPNAIYLPDVFKRICFKHYENPEDINLLKFLFARMVRLHKEKNQKKKGRQKIEELDQRVQIPLTIHAHPKWFQQLNAETFTPNENEGVVIFDLGSEIGNRYPGESIEMLHGFLADPVTPNHPDGLVPRTEEKSVKANYTVLGLQLGEIPRSQKHFREMRTAMRKAYNNEPFCALTQHPFLRNDIKYVELHTQEEMKFDEIGFVYVDYEEDKDHPGLYGATHRLFVVEDVVVKAPGGNPKFIPGRDRAVFGLYKTVEALFDPAREEELAGKRNEIMSRLGVSTKEELEQVDLRAFYSRDYSHYGNGIKIAEEIIGEPLNLEQTLLYPSYKPSLEQIVDICHERGLKIIKVYSDDEAHPTYAKILTRRMTKEERALYDSGSRDEIIFYVPKTEMSTQNDKAKRKERKARHAAPPAKKIPVPKDAKKNDRGSVAKRVPQTKQA